MNASVTPGAIRPGHENIAGTRGPPSQPVPFSPRNGPAEPPNSFEHAPRTVVAGEQDQRVLAQPLLIEAAHDLAHRPVQLFHHVAVQPCPARARERRRREQRHVRHVVRQVEEERLPLRSGRADELNRLLGIAAGEQRLPRRMLDLVAVAQQRHRPIALRARGPERLVDLPLAMHGDRVVAAPGTVEVVEALVEGMQPRLHAQMPLADQRGGVAALGRASPEASCACAAGRGCRYRPGTDAPRSSAPCGSACTMSPRRRSRCSADRRRPCASRCGVAITSLS